MQSGASFAPMSSARYAVYYTPPPDAPLARFGAGILGYDCAAGADVAHVTLGGLDAAALARATAEPRRYGFHATLVAPFYLRDRSESELVQDFAAFAAAQAAFSLGPLTVGAIGRFIALIPERPPAMLARFAGACVEHFDPFRAPVTAADRARRLASGLTPRQVTLMDRWGYPYVFDQFRFHMTLTDTLSDGEIGLFQPLLAEAFGALALGAVELDGIALMRQDDRATRFRVLARASLGGAVLAARASGR